MNMDFKWFALLTRSNFEQTVHTQITKKKIDVFLPLQRKKSRRKDRKLMIEVPLFPGYIFVRSNDDPGHQLQILKTIGAVRLLGNHKGPLSVPETQIEALKLMTSSNLDLITGSIIQLKKGDPVMIIDGPMSGVKGEFSRYKGRDRVIIKLDLLGQFAGVEISMDQIEKIPDLLS